MICGAFFLDIPGIDTATDAEVLAKFTVRGGTAVPYISQGRSSSVVIEEGPRGRDHGQSERKWFLVTCNGSHSLVVRPKGQHGSCPTGIHSLGKGCCVQASASNSPRTRSRITE